MALTKDQLAQLKPGSEVYYVGARRAEKYAAKIESIGSKYFYLTNGTKWDKQTGKQVTAYLSAWLYESEQSYNEEIELERMWDDFRLKVPYGKPAHITKADILKLFELLNQKHIV